MHAYSIMVKYSVEVTKIKDTVIYIKDAFPLSNSFINELEDTDGLNENVIKRWEKWQDGYPIDGVWTPVHDRGMLKNIDWDYSINEGNTIWPRIDVTEDYTNEHLNAYKTIRMIHEPLVEALDIWARETNNEKIYWVTKNYIIKKYNPGGKIDAHTDKDNGQDVNTFDWTALVYLNDDYTGGELEFNSLGLKISPEAGSIIFFPSDQLHTAHPVTSGNKYFIFFLINSKKRFVHSLNENAGTLVRLVSS